MKPILDFRVLLKCVACDKVYNRTHPVTFAKAMKYYHSTLINNNDCCTNPECEKPLIPVVEDMANPEEK